MQAKKGKTSASERDYQRQQEKLKTMSTSSDKVKTISADRMIEDLLKDSFKKQNTTSVTVEKADHLYSDLPFWLHCESTTVPPLYKQLWSLVALNFDRADTHKVSQLLLTSGLQVEVLGFIWSLANKIIPGQLTKQEFFIVLALVGLAQKGCTFNGLHVLKQISVPSIPILQSNVLPNPVFQTSLPQNKDIPSVNALQHVLNESASQLEIQKSKRDNINLQINTLNDTACINQNQNSSFVNENIQSQSINCPSDVNSQSINKLQEPTNHPDVYLTKGSSKNSYFPYIGSSPTLGLEDDFSEFQSVTAEYSETSESVINTNSDIVADDFTDFQSANVKHLDPFETVIISQTKEIPKISLPKSFSEKFTNLKSSIIKISPESERKLKVLSTAESLSSLPESKISSTNKVSTSISVLGGSRGVGSRLANHSFSNKPDKEKCHKHQKFKQITGSSGNGEEEIIFGIKPIQIEHLMQKCHLKNSNNSLLLKETKINNDDVENSVNIDKNEDGLDLPSTKENTRQIEIPMLGTFNETVLPTQQKISTSSVDLISVQEDKYSALREIDLVLNQELNCSKEKNDDFGDFLSADIFPTDTIKTDCLTGEVSPLIIDNDELKDWNFYTKPKTVGSETSKNYAIDEPNPKSVLKDEVDLFDAFTSLSCSAITNPVQQDILSLSAINSNSKNDNIDLFYDQSDKSSSGLQSKSDQLNNQTDAEFWNFLSSDVKPSVEVTLSRQGSLPNLDLKISAVDETEQEVIWRKCLESCHNLIQEGFDIINSIRVKSVLDEVFSASKTGHYLNCLNIVHQISKRISQNFTDSPAIQEDLEKLWGRLQELCFEYNIKLTPPEKEVSEDSSQCCICLKSIAYDLINQGGYSYHPSCANLWINCVEGTLPFST